MGKHHLRLSIKRVKRTNTNYYLVAKLEESLNTISKHCQNCCYFLLFCD